ncbi:MAG: SRPBCC family protein [Thermoleophilaceae bacterium]
MSALRDRVIEVELHLDATPTRVFPYFTDPVLYAQWQGIRAELDPRPGGHFRVWMDDDRVAEGTYLEVDPPHRLAFTWGWRRDAHVPPGSTTVEITLEPAGDGTRLLLRHSGLPDEASALMHDQGWVMFGARLRSVIRGETPPAFGPS